MSNHRTHRRRRHLAAVLVAGAVVGAVGIAGSAAAAPNQYIAQYADAVFTRGASSLHLTPGVIDDQGTISEVLEASLHQESCEGRFLVVIDAAVTSEAADIPGVEVDARGGSATVAGSFTFTGEVTITPAGRGCTAPIASASTVAPLTTDVAVDATWSDARGSVPVVYSGGECGGDGICYYRDARAKSSASSDFLGSGSARTTDAFFFEGTYSAGSAAAARVPSS